MGTKTSGVHYTPAQRVAAFWAKVKVGAPDECWEWQGARQYSGYGRVKWDERIDGSHRIAFFLSGAFLPEGMHVLHTCDNRACCNPKHLFAGTPKQNTGDCISKGRFNPRGISKLAESDVAAIREAFKAGATRKDLALQYGISYGHAKSIISGRKWKHLPI